MNYPHRALLGAQRIACTTVRLKSNYWKNSQVGKGGLRPLFCFSSLTLLRAGASHPSQP